MGLKSGKGGSFTSVIGSFLVVWGESILFCTGSRLIFRLFQHLRKPLKNLQRLIHFLFKNIFLFLKLLILRILRIIQIQKCSVLLECLALLLVHSVLPKLLGLKFFLLSLEPVLPQFRLLSNDVYQEHLATFASPFPLELLLKMVLLCIVLCGFIALVGFLLLLVVEELKTLVEIGFS